MSTTIPSGTLVTQEYLDQKLKEQADEFKKFVSSAIKGIPVPQPEPEKPEPEKPEPEKPELPKCKKGPKIVKVTVLSKRSLEVQFDGEGVERIAVFVPDRTGRQLVSYIIDKAFREKKTDGSIFDPTWNTQQINLIADLPTGKNTITYTSLLCAGSDSREFEVF